MKNVSKSALFALGALGAAASLALQSFAPPRDSISVSTSGPTPFVPGELGGVVVNGDPGDWVLVLIDPDDTPSVLPFLGGIPIALGQSSQLIQIFRVNTTGTFSALCHVTCDEAELFGLKFYTQAVAYDPATQEVCTSNVACFWWEDDGSCGTLQGCTPGYWRQPQHYEDWVNYVPDQLFSSVFEDAFPGRTLGEVVDDPGGALDTLGFHTVAALLNAADPGVNYAFTEQEVIDEFNAVFPGTDAEYEALKNEFDAANNMGCPH